MQCDFNMNTHHVVETVRIITFHMREITVRRLTAIEHF